MKSMARLLVLGIIFVQVAVFLTPTTLLFLGGMVFALASFLGANKGTVTPAFLAIAVFLLIPGYGLFSMWWLVLKFRKISIAQIPKYIWGGLVVGGITALLFALPFIFTGFNPRTPHISRGEMFRTLLVLGSGPFLLLITIFVFMWSSRKYGSNHTLNPDAPASGAPVS